MGHKSGNICYNCKLALNWTLIEYQELGRLPL